MTNLLKEELLSGQDFKRATIKDLVKVNTDLINADMTESKIINCDFSCSNLSGSKLDNASLIENILFRTNLSGASLRSTQIENCTLDRTDFSNSDLTGASLKSVVLAQTNFYNANLEGVDLRGLDLSSVNFQNVKGVHYYQLLFNDVKIICIIEKDNILLFYNIKGKIQVVKECDLVLESFLKNIINKAVSFLDQVI